MSFTAHDPVVDSKEDIPADGIQPLVMIVDDDYDTRDMLRFAIERSGCRVVEAADGDEAVRVAQAMSPNLILMDTGLPGVDGLMATERIRKLENGRAAPIIFLSGHAETEARELAFSAGGDEYLVKPVNLADLRLALKKYLLISEPEGSSPSVFTRASGSS